MDIDKNIYTMHGPMNVKNELHVQQISELREKVIRMYERGRAYKTVKLKHLIFYRLW
jgi:hypothetical protein